VTGAAFLSVRAVTTPAGGDEALLCPRLCDRWVQNSATVRRLPRVVLRGDRAATATGSPHPPGGARFGLQLDIRDVWATRPTATDACGTHQVRERDIRRVPVPGGPGAHPPPRHAYSSITCSVNSNPPAPASPQISDRFTRKILDGTVLATPHKTISKRHH
jgi:hypothetical protein